MLNDRISKYGFSIYVVVCFIFGGIYLANRDLNELCKIPDILKPAECNSLDDKNYVRVISGIKLVLSPIWAPFAAGGSLVTRDITYHIQ